jgi:hypothetical protein
MPGQTQLCEREEPAVIWSALKRLVTNNSWLAEPASVADTLKMKNTTAWHLA